MFVNVVVIDKVEGVFKFDLWLVFFYDIEDLECLCYDFWIVMVFGEYEDFEFCFGYFVGIIGDVLSCERGVWNFLSEEWVDI